MRTMRQSSCLWAFAMVLYLFLLHEHGPVDSFPTGAGGCAEGPAVGGSHFEATMVLKPTSLKAGHFDVLVNNQSLVSGPSPPLFKAGEWLLVEVVSHQHLFRGALLRVTGPFPNGFVLAEGENAGPAFACDGIDGVDGITHTDATEKRSFSGILSVAQPTERVRLDVTLVISANKVISLYYFQSFDLYFAPSLEVTSAPTMSNTLAPSMSKTLAPTISPSLSPAKPTIESAEEPVTGVTSHNVTNIQMDLVNVTYMNVHEVLRWESLTNKWFLEYYAAQCTGLVTIDSTSVVLKSSTPVELGDSAYALRVVYDQTLRYATNQNGLNATVTPEELVVLPFTSPEWLVAYIQLLNSDSEFAPNLIGLGGPITVPILLGSPVETKKSRTLANIMITLVVVLCSGVVLHVSYRLLKENRGSLKVPDFAPDTFSFIGSETSRRFGDDKSIRSLALDPDGRSMVGCQYEVSAPPGKLHIILKTHEVDGIVIEMISEASPLADKVSVGDILISVDEIDVREQSAPIVNRVIQHRKNNAVRKLVFIKGNGYCADDDADGI